MQLLPKQKEILRVALDPKHTLDGVVVEGGVRSGKTEAMAVSLAAHIMKFHKNSGHTFALCGYTVPNVQKIIIPKMRKWIEGYGIPFREYRSAANPMVTFAGCKLLIFGGSDKKSQDQIAGYDMAGGIIDEYSRLDKEFVQMYFTRLSDRPTFSVLGANRKEKMHWSSQMLFSKAHEMNLLPMTMETKDNYFLPPDYIDKVRAQTSGHMTKRLLDNEYAMAEGLVYPHFEVVNGPLEQYINPDNRHIIGADYGHSTVTAAIMLSQQNDGSWVATREYHKDCRVERFEVTQHGMNIKNLGMYNGTYMAEVIAVDPNATALMDCLYNHFDISVISSENRPVSKGINYTGACLNTGILKIHTSLIHTLQEIENYIWAESNTGEDKPRKKDDDLMDSKRYATMAARPLEELY